VALASAAKADSGNDVTGIQKSVTPASLSKTKDEETDKQINVGGKAETGKTENITDKNVLAKLLKMARKMQLTRQVRN
jgi:hypothetical protein